MVGSGSETITDTRVMDMILHLENCATRKNVSLLRENAGAFTWFEVSVATVTLPIWYTKLTGLWFTFNTGYKLFKYSKIGVVGKFEH